MARKIEINPYINEKKWKSEIDKATKNVKPNDIELDVKTTGTDKVKNSIEKVNSTAKESQGIFSKVGNSIKEAFSHYGAIGLTTAAIYKIVQVGQNAISTVKELNKEFTNLRIASGESATTTKKLMADYNKMGQDIGATTSEVSSAADDYLRAGKNAKDAATMTHDSVVLSKLGMIESAEATTDLLAVTNGYKLSVQQTSSVVDKLTAVDLESASSAGELADALKYTSTSADIAGISLDKLIAYIGVVKDTTQKSSSTIGTSFQNIFARMRNVKIGQFVDDDGEDLSDVETILDSVGIQLRDTNQEFRNFETVLDETAGKWASWSSVQQAAIAKAFAGVRNQENFLVLMEGYDKVLSLTETAADSLGTAEKKFAIYSESIESKSKSAQGALESLYTNTFSDATYASILDTSKAIINLVDETGLLKGAISGAFVGLSAKAIVSFYTGILKAKVALNNFNIALKITKATSIDTNSFDNLLMVSKDLSASQTKLLLSSKNLSNQQRINILTNQGLTAEEARAKLQTLGLAGAEATATTATATLGGAMKGLWLTLIANPLVALSLAVTGVVAAFSAYSQAQEKARQAGVDGASELKESTDEMTEYADTYKSLRNELNNANTSEERQREIKQELLELQQKLNDKYGEEYGKVNLVTGAYQDQTQALEKYNKELANKYLNENKGAIDKATGEMEKQRNYSLSPELFTYDEDDAAIRDIAEQFEDQGIKINESADGGSFTLHFNGDVTQADKVINDFATEVRKLENNPVTDGILGISSSTLEETSKVIDKYKDIYEQTQMAQITSDDGLSTTYNEATKAVENYQDALVNADTPYSDENVKVAYDNLQKIKKEIEANGEDWGQYSNIVEKVFSDAGTESYDFYNAMLKNKDGLIGLISELRGLDDIDVMSMVDDGKEDSFDKLIESAEKYGLSVQNVIDLLIQMGIIQGQITEEKASSPFTDTITQLDAMKDSLDKLDAAYASAMDGGISYSDISSLMTQFGNVSGIEKYIKAIQDAKGDTEATKEAFNMLSAAYIGHTRILNNVTDENASLITSMLEEQGVANANELVMERLSAQKEYLAQTGTELANATNEEIVEFLNEQDVSLDTAMSIAQVALAKQVTNGIVLSTSGDIANLSALVKACNGAAPALDILAKAKAGALGASLSKDDYDKVVARANKEIEDALNQTSNTNIDYTGGSSSQKSSASSGKSDADAYLEAYKKKLAELEHLHEMGQISEKDYLDSLSELNESYFNNTASNHEKYLDEYQANEEKIFSGMQSYYKDYYDNQLSALSAFRSQEISSYRERSAEILNEINSLYQQAQISAETYSSLLTSYFENQKSNYEMAAQYAQKVIQKQIKSIQAESDAFSKEKNKEIKSIEKKVDALNDEKKTVEDYHNGQIDNIQTVIDARKEEIDSHQKVIDSIQKEIDAINDKTQAEKLQYDLEQKQYLLQQARNQRTVSQFTGGEFKYTTNTDSIRDAQEGVKDAQTAITTNNMSKQIDSIKGQIDSLNDQIDSLEKQQDVLKKSMEAATIVIENQITSLQDKKEAIQELISETTEKYQEQISSLQDYSDKWSEVTEQHITAEQEKLAMELLGATSEQDILNNRQAMLALFGENYKTITDNLATVAQANANTMSTIASQMASAAQKAMEAAKKMAAARAKMGSSKYASGTKNAKEGLNEVAEGGKPEIVKFNDGTYSLYNDRSLVPMEGGETVYNGNETAKLLRQRSADLVAMIKSGTVGNFSAQNSIASNLQSSIPSTSSFKTNTTNNTSSPVIMNNSFPNVTKESDAKGFLSEVSRKLKHDSKVCF